MASKPTVGTAPIRREFVGRWVVVKLGVCPSLRGRESLVILLDKENVLLDGRDVHGKGGLRALFRFPLDLRYLGAVGESLAVAGNAGAVGGDQSPLCAPTLGRAGGTSCA